MRKGIYFISIICITLFGLIGCVTTLQNYEPNTTDEQPIVNLLRKWEATWNSHDVNGYLALINDDAMIMYGKDRKIVDKAEYAEILPERMKSHPRIKLGAPKIKISAEKADVSMVMSTGSFKSHITFHLLKLDSTWSIMSWKY